MEKHIKIETITDMVNAIKKYPNQIDVLMEDIKNFITTNIALENIFKAISEKIDKEAKTKISPYLEWIPDNKNNIIIDIITEQEKKEQTNGTENKD